MRYRLPVRVGYPSIGGSWEATHMTLLWFVIWFICDLIGDRETLTFDPVNWWAGTLLLAIALDLSKSHVKRRRHSHH